jgi:hypothetical protein
MADSHSSSTQALMPPRTLIKLDKARQLFGNGRVDQLIERNNNLPPSVTFNLISALTRHLHGNELVEGPTTYQHNANNALQQNLPETVGN